MRRLAAGLCLVLAGLAGCRDDAPSADAAKAQPSPPFAAGPEQAFRAIRQAFESGQLARIEAYVLPQDRVLLIDTLMSINALEAANNRLHEQIERHYGPTMAEGLDLRSLLDHLGLFAPQVTYVRQDRTDVADGNLATVLIQVGDRIPLERVQFVQQGGRWYFDPGTPIPEMPTVLNSLARGLNLVADRLEHGLLTNEQLLSEFRARLGPPLKRVPQMLGQDSQTGPSVEPSRN